MDWMAKTVVIDWVRAEGITPPDQRVAFVNETGKRGVAFLSHLRVVHSRDGQNSDSILMRNWRRQIEYEEFGVEDRECCLRVVTGRIKKYRSKPPLFTSASNQ